MIKKLISFTIHAHVLLTISAFVFSYGILKLEPNQLEFSLALAFAVYGVYNVHRLIKLRGNKLQLEMKDWYAKHQLFLKYSSLIALLISGILYLVLIKWTTLSNSILLTSCLVTVFYISKFKNLNLRLVPMTKSFWIALVWTLIAVVIPKLTIGSFQFNDLNFFVLFITLTIPGDIRDYQTDKPEMKTIPQLIGMRNAEILFFVLILGFLLFNYPLNLSFISLFIIATLFSFVLFQKRIPLRYELLDGLLMLIGVYHFLIC
ncbi:MAG: hypothetical protein ACOVNZ_02170 [Crocinitomicaceae bacterium]